MQAGAEYVDVEAAADFAADLIAARRGRGIVVSRHQFDAPPRDVESAYRHLRGLGAEVAKLAVAVDRLSDMLPLLELGQQDDEPHVLLAMGAAASRRGCWPRGFGTAVDEVGLGAERRCSSASTSKGMIQRVGIAQALINDPDVIFLDEPMSGLDPLAGATSAR